jgi:uncharacterized protein
LKLVLDTNVLIAAFIWGGKPYDLLKLSTQPPNEVWTSPLLLEEFHRTLQYAKLQPYLEARLLNREILYDQFALAVNTVNDVSLKNPVCRDPDDDIVLACALSANADYIISGDKDLLVLKTFEDIPILTTAQALEVFQLA